MACFGEPEPVLGGVLTAAPPRLLGAWSVRHLVTPPGAVPPGWEPLWSDRSGALWRNPRWLPELRLVGRTVVPADEAEGWRLLAGETLDLSGVAVVPPGSAAAAAGRTGLAVVEQRPERVRVLVACDGPCLLVVARPWSPGWVARVDRASVPLVRANLAGLGALIPAGEHAVELSYSPWGW